MSGITTRTVESLECYAPLPEGIAQYLPEFIEAQGCIKLREEDDRIVIGCSEKAGDEIKIGLRNFHKKDLSFVPIDGAELSGYLGNKLGETKGDARKQDLQRSFQQQSLLQDDRVLLDKLANDAPVINLVNSICIEGIRSGASDIHLESCAGNTRVRCRIDGVLRTVRTIEGSRSPAISSRIKIMANLNILERRQPQDGRITVSLGNERVDLRVSIVPAAGGESIVLRILGRKNAAVLEELGFTGPQLETMEKLIKIPHGLILITGPTGSGKTTTLNAVLKRLVSDTLKIITIEDPVEFVLDGVNQIQINEQTGMSFETLLRRVLRQDPNVIMIGEIRDTPTAEIALRSALTGHLVLSTLHTNDAASVIPRLVNMGVEPYLIASVLRGAAAQRLVRRICPECKESRKPGAEEQRFLDAAGVQADLLYYGRGCAACGHTGFAGRIIAAELFESDSALEELIMKREPAAALAAYLKRRGMKSLLREGLEKAAAGITTIEEVEREIILPDAGEV
jgi:general secretion pathway protein E/type IV pilus assembly protein PilB